jgi:hypothetical protein
METKMEPQNSKPEVIDVDSIVSKIQVPQNLKSIFDKAVLSGMRIMFDSKSHMMFVDQLEKEGPLPQKMAEGVISLMYMLWTESNKTLPPQIMAPVAIVLTLRAFEFLQESGEPEATKEALGEGMQLAITGLAERFGVKPEQLQQQQEKVGGLIEEAQNGS